MFDCLIGEILPTSPTFTVDSSELQRDCAGNESCSCYKRKGLGTEVSSEKNPLYFQIVISL